MGIKEVITYVMSYYIYDKSCDGDAKRACKRKIGPNPKGQGKL